MRTPRPKKNHVPIQRGKGRSTQINKKAERRPAVDRSEQPPRAPSATAAQSGSGPGETARDGPASGGISSSIRAIFTWPSAIGIRLAVGETERKTGGKRAACA